MKQGNLNIRCTEDYAVLYWDKPAAADRAPAADDDIAAVWAGLVVHVARVQKA